MKNQNLTLAIFFCFAFFSVNAQQNNDLTLVKAISAGDAYLLNVELDGEVSVQTWDKTFIRVETSINSNCHSTATLKHLWYEGRYNIARESDAFGLTINMPALQKKVTINSMEFKDVLTFKIFVPQGMKVNLQHTQQELVAAAK